MNESSTLTPTSPFTVIAEVDVDAVTKLADAERAYAAEVCPNPLPLLAPHVGHWHKGHDMAHPGKVCTGCGAMAPTIEGLQ